MMAAESNHSTMVDFLLSKGADAAARDKEGKTAADLATRVAIKDRLGRR